MKVLANAQVPKKSMNRYYYKNRNALFSKNPFLDFNPTRILTLRRTKKSGDDDC